MKKRRYGETSPVMRLAVRPGNGHEDEKSDTTDRVHEANRQVGIERARRCEPTHPIEDGTQRDPDRKGTEDRLASVEIVVSDAHSVIRRWVDQSRSSDYR